LSVNVIIETIAAAGGAISERAATQRSTSPEDAASRARESATARDAVCR